MGPLAMLAAACTPGARAASDGVTVHPAHNLRVHVERWDRATLRAAGIDLSEDDPASLAATGGHRAPHLATFTVVLELANRPPAGRLRGTPTRAAGEGPRSPSERPPATPSTRAAGDPLVDPAAWSFELHGPGARDLTADEVGLLAADRFPLPGGGAHWRITLAVTFRARGGEPAAPDTAPSRRDLPYGNTWTLHIRPAVDVRPRRYALGPLARRGFDVRLP